MALDTGATGTLVNPGPLVALGYDPALCTERVQVTTGSGVEFAPRLIVSSVKAFGRTCRNLAVLGHTLPPSAVVDGLLGLDFFRGTRLEIDFRDGFVRLEA
jgi:predicted aspartyl protease